MHSLQDVVQMLLYTNMVVNVAKQMQMLIGKFFRIGGALAEFYDLTTMPQLNGVDFRGRAKICAVG